MIPVKSVIGAARRQVELLQTESIAGVKKKKIVTNEKKWFNS